MYSLLLSSSAGCPAAHPWLRAGLGELCTGEQINQWSWRTGLLQAGRGMWSSSVGRDQESPSSKAPASPASPHWGATTIALVGQHSFVPSPGTVRSSQRVLHPTTHHHWCQACLQQPQQRKKNGFFLAFESKSCTTEPSCKRGF